MRLVFALLLTVCSCISDPETDNALEDGSNQPKELANEIRLQNDQGKSKSTEELKREFDQKNSSYRQAGSEAVRSSRYANQSNQVQPNYIMGTRPNIKVDPNEIISIKKRAMKGDRDAQYSLGLCYKYALGVQESKDAAAHWLKKAADQGHLRAKRVYHHLMLSR